MQNPRSESVQANYEKFIKATESNPNKETFDFKKEKIVKEFTHWYIIENRFPYDTMVRVNDMLVSKRPVSSFSELSEEEHGEYHQILEQIAHLGQYDARIENFPKTQTVKKHIHVHLVCWHNSSKG